MVDIEKVIEGLEKAKKVIEDWAPMFEQYNSPFTIDCAIALLKKQEAVKPKKADNPEESEYCCGICGYPLWLDELYCAHCGRRIEWEGR